MKKHQKEDSLRIAMLGHKYIPSRDGGVEVVVGELTKRLVRLGHSVTCFNRTNPQQKEAKKAEGLPKEYNGVRLKWVPTINRAGAAAASSSVFATIMAAFGRYDVVHIHAEGPCIICWLPRLLGKKVIVTVHGLDHMRQKWGKFASIYILLGEKSAVRFAHEIIVQNTHIQQYFREKYHRETHLIHNGVNPAHPVPAQEITEKFGLKKDGYILFLGRLVPEKGVHYLIQAYKQLHTDKKLVIAGGASDTDVYVQQLQAEAQGHPEILFTGFAEGRVLEELFSNAYVYVLPSDLEGMPLSLMEAMSFGCCCLTSDIPECADVTAEHGVTFRKGDVDDLREKLQTLCDHPEQVAAIRAPAAQYITTSYVWDDIVADTVALYRKAIAGKTDASH